MRVFLLHGFNVSDGGTGTTDKIKPYLERKGIEVVEWDYGNWDLIDVREKTDEIAAYLANVVLAGDCFIAHSHGNTIVAKAIEKGASFHSGVMIHPALRSYWNPPKRHPIRSITVFSHWTDYATWGAYLLRMFSPGNLFWGKHYWGAMGSTGALSKDPRMLNRKGAKAHSRGFSKIEKWAPKWIGALLDK